MSRLEEAVREGDVVRYTPEQRHDPWWCREGLALATRRGANVILVDTYWATLGDAHVLTDEEAETARLVFNVGDYDESASRSTWETYAPADRERITSQHGLQSRRFVRKGSAPDLPTQVQNQRERVEKAEAALRSAENDLVWERKQLAKIQERTD